MALVNVWVLTTADGEQWTFEDFAYDGGLSEQANYLVLLNENNITTAEAEAIITTGTWRQETQEGSPE